MTTNNSNDEDKDKVSRSYILQNDNKSIPLTYDEKSNSDDIRGNNNDKPPPFPIILDDVVYERGGHHIHHPEQIVDFVPEVFLANGEFNDEAIHWLPGHIVDQLYLQMCDSKTIPVTKHLLTGETYCEIENKYYAEAATYACRISAGDFSGKNAKYKPVFRLYLEDFSPRLKAELAQLPKETVHRIVTEAVFRILRARHRMIFYQHIENERLRWVFV